MTVLHVKAEEPLKAADLTSRQIFLCGDVHGNFTHIIDAVTEHKPAAIVLLGDIQAQMPLDQELEAILGKTDIWFIHGNHDTDSDVDYDNLFGSKLADRNLDGRVVEIAGVRIAGLGGIFRSQVWRPPDEPSYHAAGSFERKMGAGNLWRGGLALKHRSTIFPDVYDRLKELRADVLVTHEAPSAHPNGFTALDELAMSLHVHTTFHGHHHDCLDYSEHWDRMGYRAFGVNYCGISTLRGEVIQKGGVSAVWQNRGSNRN